MTDSNSEKPKKPPTPEELDEKTVDPRDLVRPGGYQGNPREIVENPAVSPSMLDETEGSFVGEEQDDMGS